MRRLAVSALVLACCVVSTASAEAARNRPVSRTVTATYTAGGLDSLAGVTPAIYGDGGAQGQQWQAVTVQPYRHERSVTISLQDKLGRPVAGAVVQHLTKGQDSDVELGRVCGGPAHFRLAAPGDAVTIYLLYGGSCAGAPSAPTTGVATITFSTK
jgi:hypothetical protein